jgi:beta-galactosidase
VLHAATNWTMGDRSSGGNNPLVVFSNCDEIEILIGDDSHGRFRPDRDQYPHLPHPPFTVSWGEPYNPWGNPFCDLTVRGYIGGQLTAEHKIDSGHVPHSLRLNASAASLRADGMDTARLAVQIVDKYGNVLPYQMRIVHFTLEGEADLIGANPLVLLGGQGACFVKARRTVGEVTIHACTDDLPPVSVVLQLNAD